jgi:hypothetical protein
MPAPLSHSGHDLATRDDIDRLSRQIAALTAAIERHDASLKMGLTRMGQLQADIDVIRGAWAKLPPKTGA